MTLVQQALTDGLYSFVHGTWIGAMRYTGRFKQGEREGLWRVLNPDGSVAWETTWEHGHWHGPSTTWWKRGHLSNGAKVANNSSTNAG